MHSGAQHVHACEWNPDAVEALKYNLQQNGVADRCTVYEGDNRNVSIHSEKLNHDLFYKWWIQNLGKGQVT